MSTAQSSAPSAEPGKEIDHIDPAVHAFRNEFEKPQEPNVAAFLGDPSFPWFLSLDTRQQIGSIGIVPETVKPVRDVQWIASKDAEPADHFPPLPKRPANPPRLMVDELDRR